MDNLILRMEEHLKLGKVIINYYLVKLTVKISPSCAGYFASKIWYTPLRRKDAYRGFKSPYPKTFRNLPSFPKIQVRTYESNRITHGTVVFVHGWAGSSNQFDILAEKLVEGGYKVVLFDFPGHGQSRGMSTDLWEMKEIFREVIAPIEGPVSIVCHSFGLLVAAKLLSESEIEFNKVVTIASPHRFDFIVDQFLKKTKIQNDLREKLVDSVQLRVKNKIDVRQEIDVSKNVLSKSRWLFIHDETDREVSLDEFNKLLSLNSKADTLLTSGFGHNKILQSNEVISKTIEFLRNEEKPSSRSKSHLQP